MIESNIPGVRVDEIIDMVRKVIRERGASSPRPSAKGVPAGFPMWDRKSLSFPLSQPLLPHKDAYAIAEFLAYQDRDFMENAYRCILGRFPDDGSLEYYLDCLRTGRFTKAEILGRLRFSPEGRNKKVRIRGLFVHFILQCSFRIPVLGYLLRVATGIATLPSFIRNLQSIECDASHKRRVSEERTEAILRTFQSQLHQLHAMHGLKANQNDLEALSRKLDEVLDNAVTKAIIASLREDIRNLTEQHCDLKSSILHQDRQLITLLNMAREGEVKGSAPENQDILLKELQHWFDAHYVDYEEQFRGSRDSIKDRQKCYLSYIEEAGAGTDSMPVVDIGCGRGEWLETLSELGKVAIGVDINPRMILFCRELKLDVREEDANEFLHKQAEESAGMVTGFQFIEHLPLNNLIRFFSETYRVLKKGGAVIVETPNPKNLVVGACNFYSDPTHSKPLFPESVKFLMESQGFSRVRIEYVNPIDPPPNFGQEGALKKILDDWFFCARDFAVIGFKP